MGNKEKWLNFQPLPPDIDEQIKQLPPDLWMQEGVLLAYLFGSLAQGQPANDVDIALLMADDRPAYPLRQKIADWLNIERVDVVDLAQASPVLRFEVIRSGHLLYVGDEETEWQFARAVLREYKDTAHLRHQQTKMLRERMETWSLSTKA